MIEIENVTMAEAIMRTEGMELIDTATVIFDSGMSELRGEIRAWKDDNGYIITCSDPEFLGMISLIDYDVSHLLIRPADYAEVLEAYGITISTDQAINTELSNPIMAAIALLIQGENM